MVTVLIAHKNVSKIKGILLVSSFFSCMLAKARLSRALLLGIALVSSSPAILALETGDKAPALSLPGQSGTVDLANYKGKVVYLDFWASWCVPCKSSFPWMNQMQEKYRDAGLQVIAVNLDAEMADASKFLSSNPASFTIAFDAKGQSAQRFQVKGMPTSLLIDRNGNLVLTHMGFNQGAREKLEASISTALKAQP